MTRAISKAGFDLIAEAEGLRLFAYPDIASPLHRAYTHESWGFENALMIIVRTGSGLDGGPWTIGYGCTRYPTGQLVQPGDECTQEQAREWLEWHVSEFTETLELALENWINDEMFEALLSLLYNVGPGAEGVRDGIITLRSGEPSTLLRKLNAGDYLGARDEFKRWNKAGGRENSGLTGRRKKELALFDRGLDSALTLYAAYLLRNKGEA
jgi:lysozyme